MKCTRCGGATFELFYSRACAANCGDAETWALWCDTDHPDAMQYVFGSKETAMAWREKSGRQIGTPMRVRLPGPASWFAPAWLPGLMSKYTYRMSRDGDELVARSEAA